MNVCNAMRARDTTKDNILVGSWQNGATWLVIFSRHGKFPESMWKHS